MINWTWHNPPGFEDDARLGDSQLCPVEASKNDACRFISWGVFPKTKCIKIQHVHQKIHPWHNLVKYCKGIGDVDLKFTLLLVIELDSAKKLPFYDYLLFKGAAF